MQQWIMNPRIYGPPLGNSHPPSPSTGVSVDEWVGDELPPRRASGSTRIYFVNVNGIRYGARGGEMMFAREYWKETLILLELQRQSWAQKCHVWCIGAIRVSDAILTTPNSLWPAVSGVMDQHTNPAEHFS
jgi:hypothetical protein